MSNPTPNPSPEGRGVREADSMPPLPLGEGLGVRLREERERGDAIHPFLFSIQPFLPTAHRFPLWLPTPGGHVCIVNKVFQKKNTRR